MEKNPVTVKLISSEYSRQFCWNTKTLQSKQGTMGDTSREAFKESYSEKQKSRKYAHRSVDYELDGMEDDPIECKCICVLNTDCIVYNNEEGQCCPLVTSFLLLGLQVFGNPVVIIKPLHPRSDYLQPKKIFLQEWWDCILRCNSWRKKIFCVSL